MLTNISEALPQFLYTYRTEHEHDILLIKFLVNPRLVSLVFLFSLTQTQLAPNQSVLKNA